MSIRTTRRRNEVLAELADDAEHMGPHNQWVKRFRRKPNHETDWALLYDIHHDLRTIYLQRWSPATRAHIEAARDAVDAAMRAVRKELR